MDKAPKFPKTIGTSIDHLYTLRERRKALEKMADDIKEEERALKDHLLTQFGKQKVEGAKGKMVNASVKEKDIPIVDDWPALYKHIEATGSWDLIQKRPGEAACQARWEAGEAIPGVSRMHKLDIILTKK